MSLIIESSKPYLVNITLASEIINPEICELNKAQVVKLGFYSEEESPDILFTYKFFTKECGEFYYGEYQDEKEAKDRLIQWKNMIDYNLSLKTLI